MTRLSTLISTTRRRLGAPSADGSPRARAAAGRPGVPSALLRLGTPLVRPILRLFGRVRAGYVSIAIVIAVLAAAVYTLPLGAGPADVAPIWRVPQGGPTLADGTELPVFCLPETGPAIRCGIAQIRASGQIGFVPFGALPNINETMPVLATADIGLLWALADPDARAKVRISAAELASSRSSPACDQATQLADLEGRLSQRPARSARPAPRRLPGAAPGHAAGLPAMPLARQQPLVMRDSFATCRSGTRHGAPIVSDAFWRRWSGPTRPRCCR